MLMPGRKYSLGTGYRYGFNGKENDNEVKEQGGEQDYGMRIYNPRIGKFLSVDPLSKKYPFYSPYHYAGNSPIKNIDMDGAEPAGNEWDWDVINIDHTRTVNLKFRQTGQVKIGTETQMQVKDKTSDQVWRVSKIEYYDQGGWGNWEKETVFPGITMIRVWICLRMIQDGGVNLKLMWAKEHME